MIINNNISFIPEHEHTNRINYGCFGLPSIVSPRRHLRLAILQSMRMQREQQGSYLHKRAQPHDFKRHILLDQLPDEQILPFQNSQDSQFRHRGRRPNPRIPAGGPGLEPQQDTVH